MSEEIYSLLSEITSKNTWYTKVFDDEIISKWKKEFLDVNPKEEDTFNYCLKLLQTTAQGSVHDEDCKWVDMEWLCNDCKKEIMADPKSFDLDDEVDFSNDDWISEHDIEPCEHPKCKCKSPDSELYDYVEYKPKGVVDQDLHNRIKTEINNMLEKESVDWHPGSNEQVRDLIHPSVYCYVKGVSKLKDGSVEDECEEEKRYQWLPSEFKVGTDDVKITSYVNNLDSTKYPNMIPLLEDTFKQFIPSLEEVLKCEVKNKNLQVIVKIGSICLDESKPNYPGGSWHIEGMPYENIAATCIHYVDIEGITESFLEFRKPVYINEQDVDYPQSDSAYTSHHYGITEGSHHDGVMNRYLGLVKCTEGASVVFPNTLQHKVKDFKTDSKGTRTILCFFVIDPSKRIISTEDVPEQYSMFKVEEVNYHREKLMYHRKYFVNMLNEEVFERPFSLCEH
jgi:hypothetical protein